MRGKATVVLFGLPEPVFPLLFPVVSAPRVRGIPIVSIDCFVTVTHTRTEESDPLAIVDDAHSDESWLIFGGR